VYVRVSLFFVYLFRFLLELTFIQFALCNPIGAAMHLPKTGLFTDTWRIQTISTILFKFGIIQKSADATS